MDIRIFSLAKIGLLFVKGTFNHTQHILKHWTINTQERVKALGHAFLISSRMDLCSLFYLCTALRSGRFQYWQYNELRATQDMSLRNDGKDNPPSLPPTGDRSHYSRRQCRWDALVCLLVLALQNFEITVISDPTCCSLVAEIITSAS
jgi:hypothetical protein